MHSLKQLVLKGALLLVLLTVAGCASTRSECRTLVGKIRNEHIKWETDPFGLYVSGMGEAEQQLLRNGPACRPLLVAALADESKYVAAHVLLTQLSSTNYPTSFYDWNHLRVNLYEDGRVEIPKGQRLILQRLWMNNRNSPVLSPSSSFENIAGRPAKKTASK